MYFKKLELVGFKSFMEKTTLAFEPGVTAIVGPNGCGKSNIFDSIRWVLGEQSVKSLRGSQMEDVIFNGTDAKQPLSMAEVSLTFDNENKYFPIDHKEVMITRRIFRSGESEYQLNRVTVRLKDILDLLMGTGIGAESYSLIAQGKIDLILSSRPEDRRLVFDEAAGITKYKVQKREALRKLEDTEQNLLRVGDIITEVKRSIGYLERQANKARRYKEVFEGLKSKELILSVLQRDELGRQKEEFTGRVQALKAREDQLQEEISRKEQAVNERNLELNKRKDAIALVREEIMRLENGILRDSQRIASNNDRIAELENTWKYLESQVEHITRRLIQDEEKLRVLKEEELSVKRQIEEKTSLLQGKENELNNLMLSTKTAQENIASAKLNILDLATKVSRTKNEITETASKNQVLLARKKRLEIEKLKSSSERQAIEDNLNGLVKELRQIEEALGCLTLEIAAKDQELTLESASLDQLSMDLENLERQKLTLESHRAFLQKLKTQYDSIDTSMNAFIYLDRPPAERISGLLIKVNDYLDLKDEDRRLFVASSLKLSGEAKPIDLDSQRVAEKISQIETQIASLSEAKAGKAICIEELKRVLLELNQKSQEEEKALGSKRTFHQATSEQFSKVREEEELLVTEFSDVERELSGLQEQLNSLSVQCVQLETEHGAQETLMHNEQEKIGANAHLKEEILVAITKIKTELEEHLKRLGSEDATIRMLEEAHAQNNENLRNVKKQIEDTKQKQELLGVEIKELEAAIESSRKGLGDKADYLTQEEAQYAGISSAVEEMIKGAAREKKELGDAKDTLYELQMREKDLDFKFSAIRERMLQAYKIDLDNAVVPAEGEAGGPQAAEKVDEEALSAEIEALKQKLDSCGNVNLVAIEEYDELKKRYDFLTQQQADLVAAKEAIQEAIHKINRTTRKMFVETFEKVAEEFRNYFRLLFNGGDAKVFLIDEQDPLESGIEIICRPPGKKLQNVLLLSGGEKSLSATALIFAIFKVKPAPFCVLDEIDAALDEANVERFGRLLQEFTNTSQFIVITHNKRTIANANVMYGITMIESGVSRIVSVKFAENKEKAAEKTMQPVAA